MKIYASELLNDTEVNSGSLEITTGDHIQIANVSDVAFNTATTGVQTLNGTPSEGLYIQGGSFDTVIGQTDTPNLDSDNVAYYYISGTGAQKNLADILVAKGEVVGTNLVLRNNADAQIVSNIDVSSLVGAATAGGAATNNGNNVLPVKFENDLGQNIFVDSIVTETGTITIPTQTTGAVETAVSTGSTLQIDGIPAGDQSTFFSRFSAGVGNTTIIAGGTEYTGTLTADGTGPNGDGTATFVLASGDFTGANNLAEDVAVTLPLVAGNRTVTGATLAGNLNITGNLQIGGSTTGVDRVDVSTSDTFINLAITNLPASDTTSVENINGGFLVETDRTSDGTDITKTYGGLRYQATLNRWEVSSDTTNGTNGTWQAISTHGGTVSKGVVSVANIAAGSDAATDGTSGAQTGNFNGTAIADTADIAVVTPSSDNGGSVTVTVTIGAGTEYPFTSGDLTVQVFEGANMIIPEGVSVSASSIVVTLPNSYAAAALKVVIVG